MVSHRVTRPAGTRNSSQKTGLPEIHAGLPELHTGLPELHKILKPSTK